MPALRVQLPQVFGLAEDVAAISPKMIPGFSASLPEINDAAQLFLKALSQGAGAKATNANANAKSTEGDASAEFAQSTTLVCRRLVEKTNAAPKTDLPNDSYVHAIGPLRFDVVSLEADGLAHAFAQNANTENSAPPARRLRLAKEIAGLNNMLPVNRASTIVVRVDAARQQLWRIIVFAPEDTPYAHGAFIFDAYFPPTYPTQAPLVKLRTTGNGTVTFNPNLYANGKVCLSLLGTWKAGVGESWDPTTSKMIQV